MQDGPWQHKIGNTILYKTQSHDQAVSRGATETFTDDESGQSGKVGRAIGKSVCGKVAGLIDSVSHIMRQPGDSKFRCLLNKVVRPVTKFIDERNQTREHRCVEVCAHHEFFDRLL